MNLSRHLPWIKESTQDTLSLCIDLDVYPLEVLFRTCYLFTDKCYLFLAMEDIASRIVVHFAKKHPSCDLDAIAGEFSNELINQKVRSDIAAETKPIRELIVAQAFAEADLLDRSGVTADDKDDPESIAK